MQKSREVEVNPKIANIIEKIRRFVLKLNEYEAYVLFVELGKDMVINDETQYLKAFSLTGLVTFPPSRFRKTIKS